MRGRSAVPSSKPPSLLPPRAARVNIRGGGGSQARVYAIDMIGETGLSAPSRPPLASDRYAAWLDDVWRELGVTSAPVVGVSLGGWLALDLAVRRPQKVASLVLLSPSGIGRTHQLTMVRFGLLRMCGTRGLRRSFAIVAGREMPAVLVTR
ncbi:MAG: hypothetical protein DMF93_19175 [Acidobacteria bacterium]|nr:MAG: hypothetical protein DMF93_19175 [Acidobacteriota bacterium]